jgi:hypothetical protein
MQNERIAPFSRHLVTKSGAAVARSVIAGQLDNQPRRWHQGL